MKRGSFFKSLATLVVAPKILSQIDWTKAITKANVPMTGYFNDLQLLIPEWYSQMVQKYGDKNYLDILKIMGEEPITTRKFYYCDSKFSLKESEEPVSVTLTL